jgi:hypothetical protein
MGATEAHFAVKGDKVSQRRSAERPLDSRPESEEGEGPGAGMGDGRLSIKASSEVSRLLSQFFSFRVV